MEYMKKRKRTAYAIVLLFVGVVLAMVGFSAYIESFNDHTEIFTVTDKERVYKDGDSYYLVFGEDEYGNGVVYKNEDVFIRGKWNSSDVQAELKEGNTYEVVLVGYRMPFFSTYENILTYKEIE